MVSMAAFGSTGPWKETRAYGSPSAGLRPASVAGRPDDRDDEPFAFGTRGGLNACSAAQIRIAPSQATGQGQFINSPRSNACCRSRRRGRSSNRHRRVTPRAGNRHPLYKRMASFRRWVTDNGVRRRDRRCDVAALAQVIGWTGPRTTEDEIEPRYAAGRASVRRRGDGNSQPRGVVAGAVPIRRADRRSASRGRRFWQ